MPTVPGFAVEVDEPQDGVIRVRASGELDMSTAPRMAEAISDAGRVGAVAKVVLDLSEVSFLDSSAIGAIVGSGLELKEAGGRLSIGPRSEIVAKILEITGLTGSSESFDVLPQDV